jgi:ZipA, C-terminal FtsZ-binding domain
MSDLQIGLLIIGLAVVVVVYGYGAWQQIQYRRRFGSAFRPRHGDALYQGVGEGGAAQTVSDPAALFDDVAQDLPTGIEEVEGEEVCSTLDTFCDYIAELSLNSPVSAAVLEPLWQRRFDFGKSVNVCALNAEDGSWERVIPESKSSYTSFRVALQLVDRNGAAGESLIAGFRDLVRDIAQTIPAEADLPDVTEAAESAAHLDTFCAEVDHMIGFNILPEGDRLLSGSDIAQIAARYNLTLEPDGAFHLLDPLGHTLFVLANIDNDPFRHHSLDRMNVMGLSLQLDVPRVVQPSQRFDEMVQLAREIGSELHAAVVDDYRAPLDFTAIAMIRIRVVNIENRMRSYPIVPGSAQALRLFS